MVLCLNETYLKGTWEVVWGHVWAQPRSSFISCSEYQPSSTVNSTAWRLRTITCNLLTKRALQNASKQHAIRSIRMGKESKDSKEISLLVNSNHGFPNQLIWCGAIGNRKLYEMNRGTLSKFSLTNMSARELRSPVFHSLRTHSGAFRSWRLALGFIHRTNLAFEASRSFIWQGCDVGDKNWQFQEMTMHHQYGSQLCQTHGLARCSIGTRDVSIGSLFWSLLWLGWCLWCVRWWYCWWGHLRGLGLSNWLSWCGRWRHYLRHRWLPCTLLWRSRRFQRRSHRWLAVVANSICGSRCLSSNPFSFSKVICLICYKIDLHE